MALTVSNLTAEPRSFSIGPVKKQVLTFSVANGDTTGTVTADGMSTLDHIHCIGLALTAAPTYSGNVATLAFVDPAATRYGSFICMGK